MNRSKRFNVFIICGFSLLILLAAVLTLLANAGLQQTRMMLLSAALISFLLMVYTGKKLLDFKTQLHKEKEKLQITLDSIGDGIITTDIVGNIVGLNRVAELLTGWTTEEARGKPFAQVFDITNLYTGLRAKDPVDEVLATDKICLLENHTILTSKDGIKRHIADSAAPIKDEQGLTSGVVMIFRDVTERKIAEALLKESEERFRTVFERAPIGISLSDSVTGRILEINDRFADILGRPREELTDLDWQNITHPDDLQKDLELTAKLNAGEISSFHLEKRYIRPDLSFVWINMSLALIAHTSYEHPLHLCMIEDVTRQKLAMSDLKVSESRLKTAQAIANVGNWEIDLGTRQVWASEQAVTIFGIKPYAPILPPEAVRDAIHADDRQIVDHALRALCDDDRPYDIQFRIFRADDHAMKYVRSCAVLQRDDSGRPLKAVGIIHDITQLKNSELALVESNVKLEATLQSTADGIEALDLNGNFFFFNEQFKKMWALPDDISRDYTFDFITNSLVNPNETLGSVQDLLKQFPSEPFRELSLKDGRTFARYANPIYSDGKITGYVMSYRDISERKLSEAALSASEAKHRAMIANISDCIIIIGHRRKLKYVSPNTEKLFGWRQEDLTGNDLSYFIPPQDLSLIRDDYYRLLKKDGLKMVFEFRLRCRDGSEKWIQLTAVNMLSDPNIGGILMNFHDISDRKKRESEILYLNYHDVLTGLYNRAFFEAECSRLDCQRQLPISVIMGDINGLKLVNDAFGHKEGDKLLVEMAKILSSCCRREDILARTGGDEFCILLPQTTEEEARAISKRIYRDCLNYESRTAKDAFYLSISLGYATKTDATRSIESLLTEAEEYMYKQKLLERKSMRSSLLASIRTTMYEKSHLTAEHEERLVSLSKRIGQAMGLSDAQINELELLSTLHDLGKLSIDDRILNKPGQLTDEEWSLMRKHPEVGYRIAQASPELAPIAEYILCHHERWDGSGYPQGLKGEAIPLLSRIVSVVDAYDAMTKDRPYRSAIPKPEAMDEIIANAGSQFDPAVSRIFIHVLSNFSG